MRASAAYGSEIVCLSKILRLLKWHLHRWRFPLSRVDWSWPQMWTHTVSFTKSNIIRNQKLRIALNINGNHYAVLYWFSVSFRLSFWNYFANKFHAMRTNVENYVFPGHVRPEYHFSTESLQQVFQTMWYRAVFLHSLSSASPQYNRLNSAKAIDIESYWVTANCTSYRW